MSDINAYVFIIAICLLIILSYLFNLLSRKTGIPSVLLLLLLGIGVREMLIIQNKPVAIDSRMVEVFGIISAIACSLFLYFYLGEDYVKCLIYALPLSVVSSTIVIPSISHLDQTKKEFLVYETSFSDIIGIILFNYLVAGNFMKGSSIAWFFGSLLLAFMLSIVLSFLMLFMLTRINTRVRFFLVFAVLIFLYAGGKMLHLPALFIILLFGLIVSNWESSFFEKLYKWVPVDKVRNISELLHSLTAESSFLIRTFFFFIFGLTIDISLLLDSEVIMAGSAIVLILLGIRFIYLRFFLHSHIIPELFFMPRGLITILLIYSIPEIFRLSKFNEGVLFFVILITSVIMMIGSVAYGKPKMEVINDEIPIADDNTEDDILINHP